eukprot:TRINITY_DN8335_c0_g1_i4.p1 TRINITY_DN8335_c0_g1~~TRINITY_DN8335_c0_g1_i4.p1  ORF type:complete len:116 (-),score=24.68 TRINITY_DN8335_c0_g1_i4:120-437(-)
MDAFDLPELGNNSFDVVIEKATVDSVLTGDNSTKKVDTLMSEISRVLSSEGVFISVSFGEPDARMEYYQKDDYGWEVHAKLVEMDGVEKDEDKLEYYVYVCQKSG